MVPTRALLVLHCLAQCHRTEQLSPKLISQPSRTQRALMVSVTPSMHSSVRRASPADADADADAAQTAVYFVMGGPGSGKGTQCAKLVEQFGFVHLSAGDLLRAEVRSGSAQGREIASIIAEGKIVCSEITVRLLKQAMSQRRGPFLVDGFPRSLQNLAAFEAVFEPCRMMLYLQLSEEEMEKRLLKRGEHWVSVARDRNATHRDRMPPLSVRDMVRYAPRVASCHRAFLRPLG